MVGPPGFELRHGRLAGRVLAETEIEIILPQLAIDRETIVAGVFVGLRKTTNIRVSICFRVPTPLFRSEDVTVSFTWPSRTAFMRVGTIRLSSYLDA